MPMIDEKPLAQESLERCARSRYTVAVVLALTR